MKANEYFGILAAIYIAPALPRWMSWTTYVAMMAFSVASKLEWM